MARHISTQLTTGTDDELPGVPVVPGTRYQVPGTAMSVFDNDMN